METVNEVLEVPKITEVKYNKGFFVESKNLLNEPKALQMPGYESLNIEKMPAVGNKVKETNLLDVGRLQESKNCEILICLRYFEYIIIAHMSKDYFIELLKSEMPVLSIFDMIRHHLRIKLNMEVKGADTIIEMHVNYIGKIRY